MPANKLEPGFQGSRNTGGKLTLYTHGDDPVLTKADGKLVFTGRANVPHQAPTLTSISTSKSLGAPSGTWSAEVKVPDTLGVVDLLDRIVDDDWADISFSVNGKQTHTMRGQVDSMRRRKASGGDAGGQSRMYSLSGRDHGALFEKTPIWFNQFTPVNSANEVVLGMAQDVPVASPDVIVEKLLFGFFDALADVGQANWRLPPSMGVLGNALLKDAMPFLANDFSQSPAREANLATIASPSGIPLWAFAQEWADPMFCELFCDLTPSNGGPIYMDPDHEYAEDDTLMGVFFRTKPFPTLSDASGPNDVWDSIPAVDIHEQFISEMDVGRGGSERYTMFMVSPQVIQETTNIDYTAPYWSPSVAERHGLRQFNVESRYIAKNGTLLTMTEEQRRTAVEWYAIQPYLLSGSIQLGALFPGIRVGMRIRIVNARKQLQETYYVEQVGHRWTQPSGGRTTLVVTRGWAGDNTSYLAAVRALSSKFQVAK